jgi:hypothetical protein
LNEDAPLNIPFMSITAVVFQSSIGWLNIVALLNIFVMLVTLAVFQQTNGSLKAI